MKTRLMLLAAIVIIIILIMAAAALVNNNKQIGLVGEVHEHADFMVYINGVSFNFSQEKYMSEKNMPLSNFIHLHDMDGNVLHKHAKGVTLGLFFESIGMTLNSTCLVTDEGIEYCAAGGKSLRMFVNGAENSRFGDYEFNDLDRILITYGSTGQDVMGQISSVTDKACIQSGKCPERGTPGNESSCAGGDCIA